MTERPHDRDEYSEKYSRQRFKSPAPEEELGDMHLATENYSIALEYYERALNKIHANPRPDDLLRLYLKISDCYRKKGLLDESKTFLKSAASHCDNTDRIIVGMITWRHGVILYDEGKITPALKEACKAYKLLKDSSEHREVASSQLLIANCYMRLGKNDEAEQYFLDALSTYRRIDDHIGESYVLNNLGLFHKNACRFGRALQFFSRADELCDKLGLTQHKARVMLNIGIVYFKVRDFAKAKSSFASAKKIARRAGDELKYAKANLMLGRVEIVMGDFASAERHLLEARVISERRGYAREVALADEYLGDMLIVKGDIDSAFENYNIALSQAKKIAKEGDVVAEVLRRISTYYLLKNLPHDAINIGQKAIDVIDKCGELHELGFVERTIGLAYRKLKRLDKAEEFLRRSIQSFSDLNNEYESNVSAIRLAMLLFSTKQKENYVKAKKLAENSASFFESTEELIDLANAHFLLAKIEHQLGNKDESLLHIYESKRLAEDLKLRNLLRKIERFRKNLEREFTKVREKHEDVVDSLSNRIDSLIRDDSGFKYIIGSMLGELVGKLSSGHGFVALFSKNGNGSYPKIHVVTTHYISEESSVKLASWFIRHGMKEFSPSFLITDVAGDRRISEIRDFIPEKETPVFFRSLSTSGMEPRGLIFYQPSPGWQNKTLSKDVEIINSYASFLGFLIHGNIESHTESRARHETVLDAFHQVITRNDRMLKVLNLAEKVARSDATVLLMGETGTGKGLIARAIHNLSDRRKKKFVHVNCAALPENILESELFGHVRGAFTGAVSDKKGLLAEADGGTIFLDEIGKTSLPLQGKLLQFLDTRKVRPVGSNEYFEVDVRLIFASKVDLLALCKEGKMLEDFYYRVSDFPIYIPPLRERVEDIQLLAEYYLKIFSTELGKNIRTFSEDALAVLTSYSWPGNVRELEKVVKRAVILADNNSVISPDQLAFDTLNRAERLKFTSRNLSDRLSDIEKRIISESLIRNGWNKVQTSRELGISYPTLLKKIKEYNLTEGY